MKPAIEAAAKEKIGETTSKSNTNRSNPSFSKNRKAEPPLHMVQKFFSIFRKVLFTTLISNRLKQGVSGKVTGTGNKKGFSKNRKSIDRTTLAYR